MTLRDVRGSRLVAWGVALELVLLGGVAAAISANAPAAFRDQTNVGLAALVAVVDLGWPLASLLLLRGARRLGAILAAARAALAPVMVLVVFVSAWPLSSALAATSEGVGAGWLMGAVALVALAAEALLAIGGRRLWWNTDGGRYAETVRHQPAANLDHAASAPRARHPRQDGASRVDSAPSPDAPPSPEPEVTVAGLWPEPPSEDVAVAMERIVARLASGDTSLATVRVLAAFGHEASCRHTDQAPIVPSPWGGIERRAWCRRLGQLAALQLSSLSTEGRARAMVAADRVAAGSFPTDLRLRVRRRLEEWLVDPTATSEQELLEANVPSDDYDVEDYASLVYRILDNDLGEPLARLLAEADERWETLARAIRDELVPWCLGEPDPLRERVAVFPPVPAALRDLETPDTNEAAALALLQRVRDGALDYDRLRLAAWLRGGAAELAVEGDVGGYGTCCLDSESEWPTQFFPWKPAWLGRVATETARAVLPIWRAANRDDAPLVAVVEALDAWSRGGRAEDADRARRAADRLGTLVSPLPDDCDELSEIGLDRLAAQVVVEAAGDIERALAGDILLESLEALARLQSAGSDRELPPESYEMDGVAAIADWATSEEPDWSSELYSPLRKG